MWQRSTGRRSEQRAGRAERCSTAARSARAQRVFFSPVIEGPARSARRRAACGECSASSAAGGAQRAQLQRVIFVAPRRRAAPAAADREVLARLRHHALVGGDHEQHEVDAGRAGHHRAHEALVARHVDEAEAQPAAEVERREAELDRDAARLLLGEAIGVDAGQRAHERRLAVVDVAGRAEHEPGCRCGLGRLAGSHASPGGCASG
jgi:hypothetical protein